MKRWIAAIKNPALGMRLRTFYLAGGVGTVSLLIMVLISLLIGENMSSILMVSCCVLLYALLFYFTIHYKKLDVGGSIICFLVVCVLFPICFFCSGGLYGGSPLWFVFGVVFISSLMRGKLQIMFFVLTIITLTVCYGVSYVWPDVVQAHTTETFFMDSFASVLLISFLILLLITFQANIYKEKNELAQKRSEEVEELNRAQNRFFSNMSHEIRTPINTIIGLNEMILRDTTDKEVANDASIIQGASKMLLSLINDILDMSKIESGKMDIVSVEYGTADMLSEIVNMIWSRARDKGIEFKIEVDETIPSRLFGDEVRIKQILINLLNNAIKYTKEGSVILSIQCEQADDNQVNLVYSITDTGMGIKKENIPTLFDVFQRADEEKNRYIEGTGLGLSIVKQLVGLMGGEVTVNSVYMKGSTFIVRLPQTIADKQPIGTRNFMEHGRIVGIERYRTSFEAPRANVLIVDDNEVNVTVEKKLLRDTKMNVEEALSGEECLNKTVAKKYDVILMDHLMPEMDGIECLHAIRSQKGGLNNNTPVIVLTANAGSENQQLYKVNGFDDYLLKPISGRQLEEKIIRFIPRGLVKELSGPTLVEAREQSTGVRLHKVAICITTDSMCDIRDEVIRKYRIGVIPSHIHTDDGDFLDGVETNADEIMYYLKEKKGKAHSAAATVGEYERFFAENLSKAYRIIHISNAGGVRDSYVNACEAAKAFGNVTVIDSGQISTGIGILAYEAARMVNDGGLRVDEIVEELEVLKSKIQSGFVVGSTEYLANSGMIGQSTHRIFDSIMMHPVISVSNSEIAFKKVMWGTIEGLRLSFVKYMLSNADNIDKSRLYVTYSILTKKDKDEIEAMIRTQIDVVDVIFNQCSATNAVNCGPGTFGIAYITNYKERERRL
ncbi:MAG: DegV family EDD domain-containing protein [Lachnospiraceae bacterium]|nr:DegV family EDD domain-containing protein [Lachnospiraceae bacterium]